MPPNSVAEWIVGRNIPRRKKTTLAKREVVRVELTTDDEYESDTISVTYPRTSAGSRLKKVRFDQQTKSALKKASETDATTDTSASDSEAVVIETTTKEKDKEKEA